MLQYVLITVFIIISATVAEAQTCSSGNPTRALGTYCKSDFDGGKVIPPATRRTPPPSSLDYPDPKLTPGVTNPRVTPGQDWPEHLRRAAAVTAVPV